MARIISLSDCNLARSESVYSFLMIFVIIHLRAAFNYVGLQLKHTVVLLSVLPP